MFGFGEPPEGVAALRSSSSTNWRLIFRTDQLGERASGQYRVFIASSSPSYFQTPLPV